MNKRSTWIRLLFFSFIVLTIVLRLYKISNPVGEWHSWRQADTAAVARNFLTLGFDPLRPRYDDLSNIQSGHENPSGWRMVEFPFYQSLAVAGYLLIPVLSLEIWLRLITIAAAAGTAALLFFVLSRIYNRVTGFVVMFVYAVLPYSIFYGRTILPETIMVFFSWLSLAILLTGEKNRSGWVRIFSSGIFAGIAMLIKPTALFLLLPSIYLIWILGKNKRTFIGYALVYALLTIIPFLLWRDWITQFPEGIPAYDWLFNKDGIRFKGAWFYWLFADRIGRLMTGYWGLVFLALGLMVPAKGKYGWFMRWSVLGCLLYFVVIAGGNVQHDYYQIAILPTVSALIALGIVEIQKVSNFSQPAVRILSFVVFIFMIMFSWYTVRSYYWINRTDLLEAGIAADSILPPGAKVIAPNSGDTTFLYMIRRQGWPIGFDIDKKISLGATHYVTVSIENDYETKEMIEKYKVLVKNDKFVIVELQ